MLDGMFSVFVEGLECYGHHGVSEAERTIGHRFLVDLEMEVDGSADRTDDVSETADYSLAVQIAQDVIAGEPCRTVERLASLIGESILAKMPLVHEVRTTVAKRLPPVPAVCEASGATVLRTRR